MRETQYGSMILPDGEYYSLDSFKTRLNNNVMVVGTSGASKTRSMVTPNLLECTGSYIVTDPKGNLYKQWGAYMKANGYDVLRVSFIHPEQSVKYNPLTYVNTTQEIQQLSHTLVYNGYRGQEKMDPFWDQQALMLLNSVIAIAKSDTLPKQPYGEIANFRIMLLYLKLMAKGNSEDGTTKFTRILDNYLRKSKKDQWAVGQFDCVNQAPNRTFDSIVSTVVAKLSSFDTDEINSMMEENNIDFASIGQKKTAVFVEVSDSDRSMDLLVNIFFTQAMNALCTYADEKCRDSRLPVPVRFIMDDFATNCKISNFDNMISNIRSRNISAMLILQSFAQLEKGYGESAGTIKDNCDTLVYMGGNDVNTAHEIAIRANKTTNTILEMPVCTSWIFRRGSKPVKCATMELDDYLAGRGITLSKTIEESSKKDDGREAA